MSLAVNPVMILKSREIFFVRKSKLLTCFLGVGCLILLTTCHAEPSGPRLAIHTLKVDDSMLQVAQQAEFDTIVQVFPWREIEPTQNQFHWEATDQIVAGATYYDLDLIVRLDQHPAWASEVDTSLNAPPDDLTDYEQYVQRVVERYQGQIKAYILWNEPNLAIEWGGQQPDAAEFTELLRVGYKAVKTIDAEAVVVAAGLAPTNSYDHTATDERIFLRQMYEAGAAAYFDVLAAHSYSFGQPPTASAQDDYHPAFNRLAELRSIMETHGDKHKPVWITEMGWTINPPPYQADIEVTLEQQADYLAEALTIIRRDWPWVELVTVWNLSIPTPNDPFSGYSLLGFDGQPRPALAAWQTVAGSRHSRGVSLESPIVQNEIVILGADVKIHLGDTDLQPPWWPLFGGRKPSLTWSGSFYLVDPGETDWSISLELMQQNEIGAMIAINGVRLTPNLPQQDFTRRWLTVHRMVPHDLLQSGHNQLTVTTVRLLPDAQQDEFVWDDFQIQNIRLTQP